MNKSFFVYLLAAAAVSANAADYTATEGAWTLEIPETTGRPSLTCGGIRLFNDIYASATYNFDGEAAEHVISSRDAKGMPEVSVETADDCFGTGRTYVLSYKADGVTMRQRLSFYEQLPYMIAQVEVSSDEGRTLRSGSLTALAVNASSTPLNGASNRMVWVPFDNDGHLKYEINVMKDGDEMTSHEVGYVFDGETRRGLIGGSVDHDLWKSGVTIAGTNGYRLDKFECLSGYTDYFSRDALPHGKVKGQRVASARFFVGLYDDWREGLNDYGDANTKVVPKAEWTAGNPMGWSSWGVQQNYINYDGVEESARFIKDNLFELGFHDNCEQTVISLDAFASDNIPSNKIWSLGTKVFAEGSYRDGRDTKEGTNQRLGLYCGPFVAWEWALDSKIPGTGLNGEPDYTYRDIALKVNGTPYVVPSNGGCAVDPTHPALKAHIAHFLKQYATNGAKYIKVDFLNNGIIEGDSWYDPEVTTGVQAYNYGMKILLEEASKYGMYIVESISPIFPYQYAHGRRTCCDRFSEIGETEYVMNAISYGWWTDRLYTVNDPDQLVMCKGGHGARETLGENRARATSGMATGAFIFGDNFSDKVVYTDDNGHKKGDIVGYPEESRTRALTIMGNADINEYVRNNTGSFMPVDGHKPSSSQSAESMFVRRTGNQVYLAVFNYKSMFASTGSTDFARIGVADDETVSEIKELWSGEIIAADKRTIDYSVPAKDVKVYRFTLGDAPTAIGNVASDTPETLAAEKTGMKQFILTGMTMQSIEVYDISGKKVMSVDARGENAATLDLSAFAGGIYIVEAKGSAGMAQHVKIVNR
ncbi:MAG: T9SS type A sorting domain-containing protein [Duncaniella sp.]|nr:T9SS type A sorting domain-containing protein [Duncaniella sp.]